MSSAKALPAAAAPAPAFWIRRRELLALGLAFFGPPLAAWAYFVAVGLPPTSGYADPANPHGAHQFPAWLRGWHYLNLLLVVLLGRTGGRILAGRPWLAWSEGGEPWVRWGGPRPGAGGDAAPAGEARRLRLGHATLAVAWAVSGAAYGLLVALTGEAEHLLPLTRRTVPEAWAVFVQYSTFHLPLDPDGYYRYNSLQLLSYAIVMLGFVPLIAVTGLAISPAFGRLGRFSRLGGAREAARSVHYLAILGYLAFIAVHVFFVVLYAAWLNGHHVVMGTDETGLPGWLIGGAGLGGIGLAWLAARRLLR